MLWRGMGGAVLGAGIAALSAVAITALLLGFQVVVLDAHDLRDRTEDAERLGKALPMAIFAGIVVGAIGGLAAKLPRKGLAMLPSLSIVAACAVITRLPVLALPRYKGSPEPSWIPALVAALVGGMIVLIWGVAITKRNGSSRADASQSDTVPHS